MSRTASGTTLLYFAAVTQGSGSLPYVDRLEVTESPERILEQLAPPAPAPMQEPRRKALPPDGPVEPTGNGQGEGQCDGG